MAELADAQASGACYRKVVEVQILSSAPPTKSPCTCRGFRVSGDHLATAGRSRPTCPPENGTQERPSPRRLREHRTEPIAAPQNPPCRRLSFTMAPCLLRGLSQSADAPAISGDYDGLLTAGFRESGRVNRVGAQCVDGQRCGGRAFLVAPDRPRALLCGSALMSSGPPANVRSSSHEETIRPAGSDAGRPAGSLRADDRCETRCCGGRAGEGNVEQALTKIEHDSLAALLKKDAAGFGKYLTDDAVLTGPDGMVQTKAQLLADVTSGALNLESSDVSDMKVHVHGDAAVVTYASVDKGKDKTQDISGRSLDGFFCSSWGHVADCGRSGNARSGTKKVGQINTGRSGACDPHSANRPRDVPIVEFVPLIGRVLL